MISFRLRWVGAYRRVGEIEYRPLTMSLRAFTGSRFAWSGEYTLAGEIRATQLAERADVTGHLSYRPLNALRIHATFFDHFGRTAWIEMAALRRHLFPTGGIQGLAGDIGIDGRVTARASVRFDFRKDGIKFLREVRFIAPPSR